MSETWNKTTNFTFTFFYIQEKTNRLSEYGEQVSLKINSKKTKLMMTVNVQKRVNVTVREKPVEVVKTITYLGSVMSEGGGAEEDIQARLGKASMEIQPVQEDDQDQDVWKLRKVCATVWVRMLEDDKEKR